MSSWGEWNINPVLRVETGSCRSTVQNWMACTKREQSHSKAQGHCTTVTTGCSFPGYSPSPLSVRGHATPPPPPIYSSLFSAQRGGCRRILPHLGSLQVANGRHWWEAEGQEEREVGTSSLKWQVQVALLSPRHGKESPDRAYLSSH